MLLTGEASGASADAKFRRVVPFVEAYPVRKAAGLARMSERTVPKP